MLHPSSIAGCLDVGTTEYLHRRGWWISGAWLEGQIFRSFYVWRKVLADVDRGAKPSVGVPGRKSKWESWSFWLLTSVGWVASQNLIAWIWECFNRGQRIRWGVWLDYWPVGWFELRTSALEKIGKMPILTLQAAENGVWSRKNQSDIPGNLGQNGWLRTMVGMSG